MRPALCLTILLLTACAHTSPAAPVATPTAPPAASPATATATATPTTPATSGAPTTATAAPVKPVSTSGYTVALLEMAIRAAGGEESLRKLHDLWAKVEFTLSTGSDSLVTDLTLSVLFPGKVRVDIRNSGSDQKIVITDDYAYVASGPNRNPIEKPAADKMRESMVRSSSFVFIPGLVLLEAVDKKFQIAAHAPVQIDGRRMDVLEIIDDKGTNSLLFLDGKTHLVVRQESALMAATVSDYHKVGGVEVPYVSHIDTKVTPGASDEEAKVMRNTKANQKIVELKVNQGIADDVFKK